MHSRPQQSLGPVIHQIANVDENRQHPFLIRLCGSIGLASTRIDRHSVPLVLARQYLQSGLPRQLEEQGQAAVIAVGAGADVDAVFVVVVAIIDSGVVEEAEYAATCAAARSAAGPGTSIG